MLESAVAHNNRLLNLFQQLLSVARIPSFPLSNLVVSSILLTLYRRFFRQIAIYQEIGNHQSHNFLMQARFDSQICEVTNSEICEIFRASTGPGLGDHTIPGRASGINRNRNADDSSSKMYNGV